jgi:hypothetical protein
MPLFLCRLASLPVRRSNSICFAISTSYTGVSRLGLFAATPPLLGLQKSLEHTFRRGFTTSPSLKSDNMGVEDAFREMEANGVPKQGQPTAAAASAKEQQKELPKMSAAEFRVYNRMAEHMDLFVRFYRRSPSRSSSS